MSALLIACVDISSPLMVHRIPLWDQKRLASYYSWTSLIQTFSVRKPLASIERCNTDLRTQQLGHSTARGTKIDGAATRSA